MHVGLQERLTGPRQWMTVGGSAVVGGWGVVGGWTAKSLVATMLAAWLV